jgi:hypothetical protein
LTGTALPLILMLIGEPTDRKMSDAFLSDISLEQALHRGHMRLLTSF